MIQKKPIIIDTDAGHDDALALMLVILSGKYQISAITTVAGNSTIQNVTRNAAYILDLIGKREIPIYSGYGKPIKRTLVQAVVHGKSGLAGAAMSETKYSLSGNAPEKIVEIISDSSVPLRILTLGPLSNIARALTLDPYIGKNIAEIVIMGGAISCCGNKNRVAEFNMFVDPEAADIVFRSAIKKILVPLDPCNNIILQLSDFEKLRNMSYYSTLMNMMRHFIRGIESDEGTSGALVYDALAGYYLINPDAFTFQDMDIVIETKGEHTTGMTVAEKRKNKKKMPNIKVATYVNENQFKLDFIKILTSRDER